MSTENKKNVEKVKNILKNRKKRHSEIMLRVGNGADDDCDAGGGLV